MNNLSEVARFNIRMALHELSQACYQNAKNKGFWEDEDNLISALEELKSLHYRYNDFDKHKKRIISLFNSEKIALEMSELAERLEVLRKAPDKMDEHCPEFLNLEIECADLIIRCLDFCGKRNLRIGEAILAKMKYNESREYKHGKNF